jgi:uncharacterized protein YcnI
MKVSQRTLLVFVISVLALSTVALAHVTILPREGRAGVTEEFTMRVPNENPTVDMISFEVEFPANLNVSYLATKPGWKSELKKDAKGRITGAVWTGGVIAPKEYSEFKILGRTAAEDGKLQWKTVEGYKDGSKVEMKGLEGAKDAGPVSTVKRATNQ